MTRPAHIRDALIAARDITAARDVRRAYARPPARLRTRTDRRWLEGALAVGLAKSGVDIGRWERELTKSRTVARRRLEALKDDAVRQSTAHAKGLQSGVDERRTALDLLAATAQPATDEYVSLDSPFLIWTSPLIALDDSTIEPWNSRARMTFERSNFGAAVLEDIGSEELTFYFLWDNPADGWALVTVDGFLVLNGFCTAHSRGGIFTGGSAALGLDACLEILQSGTDSMLTTPLPQTSQSVPALRLDADSSGWFSDDETTHASVFRGFDLRYAPLAVPPRGVLVIDISLSISYGLLEGSVAVDFSTADFGVICPFVSIHVVPELPTNRDPG
jgi:hypothetical protein